MPKQPSQVLGFLVANGSRKCCDPAYAGSGWKRGLPAACECLAAGFRQTSFEGLSGLLAMVVMVETCDGNERVGHPLSQSGDRLGGIAEVVLDDLVEEVSHFVIGDRLVIEGSFGPHAQIPVCRDPQDCPLETLSGIAFGQFNQLLSSMVSYFIITNIDKKVNIWHTVTDESR